jgi:CRP-like cAMP-binding protein
MEKFADEAKAYYGASEHYYTQIDLKEDKKFSKEDLKKLVGKLFNKSKEDSPKQLTLFHGLTEDEFKKVANLFYYRKYSAGEYLFQEGYPGSALFYIKSGQVVIQKTILDILNGDKHDIVIATLNEGNMFGEMSLMDDSPRSTDAVCSHDSEVLMLFRSEMRGLFNKIPTIGYKIMSNLSWILSGRLKNTNNELVKVKNENKDLRSEVFTFKQMMDGESSDESKKK